MIARSASEPAELAVTLPETKRHLRISEDVTDHDELLTGYIKAAVIEAEERMGLSFVTRDWIIEANRFPGRAEFLPVAPIESVASVKYIDSDGVQQTVDPENYYVMNTLFGFELLPADNYTWPTLGTHNAVPVELTVSAGFGTADEVPEDIKTGLMFHVQALFDKMPEAAEIGERILLRRRRFR